MNDLRRHPLACARAGICGLCGFKWRCTAKHDPSRRRIILEPSDFKCLTLHPRESRVLDPVAGASDDDVALVPMAMPIMFGPGAIATIIGMSRTVKKWAEEVESFVAIVLVIIATMGVNFVSLLYSKV